MISYKTVIARHGQTWDSVAFENYGDGMELSFTTIMQENRQFSRTLAFDGGESVIVPLSGNVPIILSNGEPSSQQLVSIIKTPW